MGIVNYVQNHVKHDGVTYLPSEALITAICLAHDIGHPPFGHAGEQALDFEMREYGGFEGNGQTLRHVARIETHTSNHGLNLTRRVLLGLLKYPAEYQVVCQTQRPMKAQKMPTDWKPPKCYLQSESHLVDWILEPLGNEREEFSSLEKQPTKNAHGKTKYKSLDCSIMELADDIAYGVHDLEDGVALGLVRREHFHKLQKLMRRRPALITNRWMEDLFGTSRTKRKQAIGRMVHACVTSCRFTHELPFSDPIVAHNVVLSEEALDAIDFLHKIVWRSVIRFHPARTLEWRGQYMVSALFRAIEDSPGTLLRSPDFKRYRSALFDPNPDLRWPRAKRIICDYVAGMTDVYASRIYERLFIPRLGSVFERI